MTPPPINIDGSDITDATIDGTDVSEVTVDGTQVFSAIPDSVVSRPADNDSFDSTNAFGARIETDVEWPSIGARISQNTAGFTTASIYRVNDGSLLGSTDISGLAAGDTFVINEVNLQPDDGTDATTYNFVVGADGSNYTYGFYGSPSYPYTSTDGDLRIIDAAQNATGTNDNAIFNLVDIGNVGI